jgi:2-oxo-4-hydroxy-4-carboxy-5-ureidoimidazoline decarboxylase
VSTVLEQWNRLSVEQATGAILPCCGSKAWARGMAARRPLRDEPALLLASDETWRNLAHSDWLEAFQSHPRIGESHTGQVAPAQAAAWSAGEQKGVADADAAVKIALAQGNREYERRFGRIFIVCATTKSATEILEMLRRRLQNDAETELREAAEQQRQITQIRLRKWLQG